MALPADFARDRVTPPRSFIVISLVPGDPTFEVELQRALEDGSTGLPDAGTAKTVAKLPPVPNTGAVHKDWLPQDNLKRFYRARHIRDGWTPGPWSAWTSGLVPAGNVGPALTNRGVTEVNIMMNAGAAGGVGTEHLSGAVADRFGNVVPGDLLFNGDFEADFAYWATIQGPRATIVTGGSALVGSKSLQLAVVTSGGFSVVSQVPDGRTTDAPSAALFFRVQPNDLLVVDAIGKLSASIGGINMSVSVTEWDEDKATLTTTAVVTWSTETVATPKRGVVRVGATTRYVTIYVTQSGTAGSAQTFTVDEIHVERWPGNVTLGTFDNGTKSGAFTLDWSNGNNQQVEINGTNLAITLSNPLEGAVYIVYLKQNSSPDTVTWPGAVHWKDGVTPTLSTTTGRLDRVELHHVGGVYYGTHTSYWT